MLNNWKIVNFSFYFIFISKNALILKYIHTHNILINLSNNICQNNLSREKKILVVQCCVSFNRFLKTDVFFRIIKYIKIG